MRWFKYRVALVVLPLLAVLTPGLGAAQASKGILKVDANIQGATVLIDGTEVGVTPLMTAYDAGSYELTVQKLGYEPHVEQLDIQGGKKVKVTAKLERVAGSVKLKVSPAGAFVSLDGVDQGQMPDVSLDVVAPGAHKLIVTKPGHSTFEKTFTLAKQQEILITVQLEATDGVLTVNTEPAGAAVFADGKELGVSPFTTNEMPSGLHAVRLVLDGYADKIVSVNIAVGAETEIDHTFSTALGGLKVIPEPLDAEVSLDAYPLGTGEQNLEALSPGLHNISLTASDFLDLDQEVLIKEGKSITVRANMTPGTGRLTNGGGIKIDKKKAAPAIVAIVGAVTTGTIIAIAAATSEGEEPPQPNTDFVFELP